jgi:hypothetical protein
LFVQINFAEQRSSLLQLLNFELQRLITQNATLSVSALSAFAGFAPPLSPASPIHDSFRLATYNISDLVSVLSGLNVAQHQLVSELDRTPYDHEQSAYMYGDLCVAGTPADCSTWQSGTMTLGLLPSVLSLDMRVRALLDVLNSRPLSLGAANATLQSSEVRFVRDFVMSYVPPSLDASLLAYVQSEYISFQSKYHTRLALLLSFLAFLVLFFVLFFHRYLHALNAETRRIGAIFLTIPSSVLDSMSKTTDLRSLLEQTVAADVSK